MQDFVGGDNVIIAQVRKEKISVLQALSLLKLNIGYFNQNIYQ